ncbi:hypothetical protein [Sphingomonas sp. S-NIH.Pt15_0812]|jgi:hypothetical protein|nr:hypothetical protein [Sphingomonas sp. S-NIH.Pt15_0812]
MFKLLSIMKIRFRIDDPLAQARETGGCIADCCSALETLSAVCA